MTQSIIPSLSREQLLAFPHPPYSVLLGAGLDGQPVTHQARVYDGGHPSLLLIGWDALELLSTIEMSCISWYKDSMVCVERLDGGLDIDWMYARLTVTLRPTLGTVRLGSRACCVEQSQGVWKYVPRVTPLPREPVEFYLCRG